MPKKTTRTEEVGKAEVLSIPVHLIEYDPELDVRPAFGNPPSTDDHAELLALADNIAQVGQINPGAALEVPNEDGTGVRYFLIDGGRRKAAITLNAAAGLGDTMDVKIFRGDNPADALRKALSANLHRKDFTHIQLALNMQKVRTRIGTPEAPASYATVARFCNVEKPTVIKYLHLLEYPTEIQEAIHTGKLSMAAAKELEENTKTELKQAVKDLAKKKAEQGAAAKNGDVPVNPTVQGDYAEAPAEGATSDDMPVNPATVQTQHIQDASRELGAQIIMRKLSIKQLIAHFGSIGESSAFGFVNSPARVYATNMVGWLMGDPKVNERRMIRLFSELSDNSGAGTPNATERRDLEEQDKAIKVREAEKLARQAKKATKSSVPTSAPSEAVAV